MKNKIIDACKKLINLSNGNVNSITIRKIACEANVGIGLINYHFGSKEKLIEISIEQMINEVVKNYQPQTNSKDEIDKIYESLLGVAEYLWTHKEVSKISILSDFKSPNINDNSVKSLKGLINASPRLDNYKSFILISVLQVTLLRQEIIKEIFNIDLDKKEDREVYLKKIIESIFFGDINENSDI